MILWTRARQAPLSMGFSRQEYWGRLPFPSPGDLPNPGIKPPMSPATLALAVRFFTTSATWEASICGHNSTTRLRKGAVFPLQLNELRSHVSFLSEKSVGSHSPSSHPDLFPGSIRTLSPPVLHSSSLDSAKFTNSPQRHYVVLNPIKSLCDSLH